MTQGCIWKNTRLVLLALIAIEDLNEYTPTAADVGRHAGYSSCHAGKHLRRLVALGYVRHHTRYARDWRTTPQGRAAAQDPRPPADELPSLHGNVLKELLEHDADDKP
jgi:DNA-binding MarR family transcriptional regulator